MGLPHEAAIDATALSTETTASRLEISAANAHEQNVEVDCPACDSAVNQPAFEKYGFRYVRCTDCLTLFMTPRPSEKLMAEYYANSENYAFLSKHIFPVTDQVRRQKIHAGWLDRVLTLCRDQDVLPGTLIEIGSGYGSFGSLALASGNFDRIVAIEPTPEMAEACRKAELEVIESRIEDIEKVGLKT